MLRCVALAVYGCTISGVPTESVDFQVHVLDAESTDAAGEALKAVPTHEYRNEHGEVVAWPLAVILDIQTLSPEVASGTEVAGAITSLEEIGRHLPGAAV